MNFILTLIASKTSWTYATELAIWSHYGASSAVAARRAHAGIQRNVTRLAGIASLTGALETHDRGGACSKGARIGRTRIEGHYSSATTATTSTTTTGWKAAHRTKSISSESRTTLTRYVRARNSYYITVNYNK